MLGTYSSMINYNTKEIQSKINAVKISIDTIHASAILVKQSKPTISTTQYARKITSLHKELTAQQLELNTWREALHRAASEEQRLTRIKERTQAEKVAKLLKLEITNLKQAIVRRSRKFKALRPRVDLNGLHQKLVDGRLPIDIDYFKSLVKLINIDGKATLVTRSLEQPVTWRGTTGNNVTIMDRSVSETTIYQAHRIVYAITTGIDPVDSDITYKDGNVDNYAFSNLIYKG